MGYIFRHTQIAISTWSNPGPAGLSQRVPRRFSVVYLASFLAPWWRSDLAIWRWAAGLRSPSLFDLKGQFDSCWTWMKLHGHLPLKIVTFIWNLPLKIVRFIWNLPLKIVTFIWNLPLKIVTWTYIFYDIYHRDHPLNLGIEICSLCYTQLAEKNM